MDLAHQFTLAFAAFFAIMNPLAGVPVFLSLTAGENRATMRQVAFKGLLYAFGIVLAFSVAGKLIFELFGITLPALRITGGILIFVIGFQMLQGQSSSVHAPSRADQQDARAAALSVAVTPLAMPLLAGPGTIATAMNLSAHGGLMGAGVSVAAFGILCVITYFVFIQGHVLVRLVGQNGMNALTRMMGLILAVIGMQMLISGIHGAFHLPAEAVS
ncbi:MAG: MarC family protein [Pseudomonadota bacterium]|nr:MarC family protein [Pseudomonadota bacterium]